MSLLKKVQASTRWMNKCEENGHRAFILCELKRDEVIKFIQKFLDMKKSEVTDEILNCIEDIIIHSKTIYEIDRYVEPYEDEFYDKMLSKYKKFRDEPYGNGNIGNATVGYKYETLAGTLDKYHFIYNEDRPVGDERGTLEEFFDSLPINKLDEISILVNQKKDGTSVVANYVYDEKKNRYYAESGISRGRKSYGEGTDVSIVFKDIIVDKDRVKVIKESLGYIPKEIGIQYEMLVSDDQKKAFEKFSGKKFANHRSAVSGLLRRLIFATPKDQRKMKDMYSLVPVGFDTGDNRNLPWANVYITLCKAFIFGDIDMEVDMMSGNKAELLLYLKKYAEKQNKKRKKLNHAIDGLVVTILDKDLQSELGRKNGINKWQAAYKFPEEYYKTKIIGYEITTGNFGYKDLLLITEPVVLNGTTQFKIQTHSLDRLKKLDPRVGDEIYMQLSGDVIPYGYKDKTCKKGKGPKIRYPVLCDCCGAMLVEENNRMRCPNKSCSSRVTGLLTTFFTELNSKGIGAKTCEKLHNELGVNRASDLLKLKKKDLNKVYKDGTTNNILNTISDVLTRPRTMESILSSLGIDSFRTSTAAKLLEVISPNDLIDLIDKGDKEELTKVLKSTEGIDMNASIIAQGLIDNIDELKELCKLMTIKAKKVVQTDKVLVVSGFRPDDDFIDKANAKGYKVKDSGKKMDLLVIKDPTYSTKSKAVYAAKNDIPIITLREFEVYLNG